MHGGVGCIVVGNNGYEIIRAIRLSGQYAWVVNYTEQGDPMCPPGVKVIRNRLDLMEHFKHSGTLPVERVEIKSAKDVDVSEIKAYTEEAISAVKTSWNTVEQFGTLWLKNMLLNIGEIPRHQTASVFQGQFEGATAIIIGAGPSLSEDIELISKHSKEVVTICTSRSLRACKKAGFTPTFTLCVDPQDLTSHFADMDLSDVTLGMTPVVNPAIWAMHTKNKFSFSSNNKLDSWPLHYMGEYSRLQSGGSVACVGASLAFFMGCKQIIYSGVDLAFIDGRVYSKGSSDDHLRIEDEKLVGVPKTAEARDLEGPDASSLSQTLITVQSNGDKPLKTSRGFHLIRVWLEQWSYHAMQSGVEIVNTSLRGAKMLGVPCRSLDSVKLYRTKDPKAKVDKLLDQPSKGERKQLCKAIQRMEKDIPKAVRSSRKVAMAVKDLDMSSMESFAKLDTAESKMVADLANIQIMQLLDQRSLADIARRAVNTNDFNEHKKWLYRYYDSVSCNLEAIMPLVEQAVTELERWELRR